MRLPLMTLCGSLVVAMSIAATPAAAQEAQVPAPPPGQPPSPAPIEPLTEENRSLFAPTWNTFQFSGRLSNIDGDEARFQRYEDLRNGPLLTGARWLRETPDWG